MTVVSAGREEVVQVERPKMGSGGKERREGREGELRAFERGSERRRKREESSPCLISKEG